ncbi:MAG: hypothetical protein R3179_08605, partial [Sedimenticolaceae bacterium]|nr:hypothetical protein [Sedimenticolaceae bacterium]
DVTDTSWTKVSESDPDISYSRNATGIDNLANAASTLSDGDTGIRAEVSASETIPDDSNPYSVVFFVPKDSNSTTFSAAILALTGGTTTLQQTANWKSSDGTSDELSGYSSDGEYAVTADIDGDWWRVTMTIVNNSTGNTTATLYLIPAANTTLGAILSATPTRDMIFDSVMFLENVDFDLAKSLKPILTDGATVLTDDDDVYFDIDNNFANSAYTVIFDWIPSVSQADLPSGSDYGLVTTSNATTGLAYYDDGGIKSVDGSSNETALNLGFVAGKTYRIACHGTSSSTFQIGAKNITDAGSYSWSTATTFAGFTLGDYIRTFYNQTYPGQIKDLLIFDSDKSTTWIETHY